MHYQQEEKLFITNNGNSMNMREIYNLGLDEIAIDMAWPRVGINTLGNQPTLFQTRTQEVLEKLIDKLATTKGNNNE